MAHRRRSAEVLVLGTGMSGTTAALAASRLGATVTMVEKSVALGGSAALSAGMFWTAPNYAALRRRVPLGDAELGRSVIDGFQGTLDLIRSTGASVADEPTSGIMTYGLGHSFDVGAYLDAARAEVIDNGGELLIGARVLELLADYDGVNGAILRLPTGDVTEIQAPAVVLATGGFQGDRELLHRYIGPNADRLLLRSNPGSNGDGLRLATQAGAAATGAMSTFYGHLLPYPVQRFEPQDYLPYAQYYSGETVVLNLAGERFIDETLGDELINQDLVRQPEARGILVFDDRVRRTEARKEPFPGTGLLDRVQIAINAGGHYASAESIDALVEQVADWGLDAGRMRETLIGYGAAVAGKAAHALGVPVSPHARPLMDPPFHAIAVQPSVTFTFGGIRTNAQGYVLSADGERVPGLYAAGADVGGLSNYGYAGGLAPAGITGRHAGTTAAHDARRAAAEKGR